MVMAGSTGDGARVSTHVLYPSNGAVSVVVRGRETSFIVSDEGGGIAELGSAGLSVIVSDRMIGAQLRMSGMRVRNGVIMSPTIPMDAVPAAIMLVANASRTVADWGISHLPFRQHRSFREDLAKLLGKYFHDNMKSNESVVGKSNKPHKFGHVVHLFGERRLLIDPVVNDSSSINARLVSNLDVKMTDNSLIEQIIVFDDKLKWKASDLSILEMGAPTVAFSMAEREIRRRVA